MASTGIVLATLGGTASANRPQPTTPSKAGNAFAHLATFDVMDGNGSQVAEIIDVTTDGNTLVYTDSPSEAIGFVDLTDPSNPLSSGSMEVGGEPTSLAVAGPHILVAVNTSVSFADPSGELVVIDATDRIELARVALAGQPDSVALAPDGLRLAVVIENERDEDLDDGLIPQAPSGGLQVVELTGLPTEFVAETVDLSEVAATAAAGTDLEPEYVDVNRQNEAVVSFQENNHLAVIDLVGRSVLDQFPAGSVQLDDVDTAEDDVITLDSTITKRREPDAVAWIDDESFATANEGDYEDVNGEEGGSRGFTIFSESGEVLHESGGAFEHLLVRAGHYNEARSENKGVEPETVEVGVYGGRLLLFVASERSNAVAVYQVNGATPKLLQILPTGIGPEGIKAIPARNLLVASTETDEAGVGIPTMVNVYGIAPGAATYPMLESADDDAGLPIPWAAISGLAGDPRTPQTVHAVSDSFFAEGFVYTIDVARTPARITDRMQVTGASADLDLEGIAVGADGTMWLGSEGNAGAVPNLVLRVDPSTGEVLEEHPLPADMTDGHRSNGIEGIAVTDSHVYVSIQRAWPGEGDLEGLTKIGRLDRATGTWTFVHYPLEPIAGGDWIGLSELTLLPDGTFAVVERDKGWGPTTGFNAELKAIYGIDLVNADFQPYGTVLATIDKELLRDLVPDLTPRSIWTPEKVEGLAVTANGRTFVVTDNDGVDGATGETVFLGLGRWKDALGR